MILRKSTYRKTTSKARRFEKFRYAALEHKCNSGNEKSLGDVGGGGYSL